MSDDELISFVSNFWSSENMREYARKALWRTGGDQDKAAIVFSEMLRSNSSLRNEISKMFVGAAFSEVLWEGSGNKKSNTEITGSDLGVIRVG